MHIFSYALWLTTHAQTQHSAAALEHVEAFLQLIQVIPRLGCWCCTASCCCPTSIWSCATVRKLSPRCQSTMRSSQMSEGPCKGQGEAADNSCNVVLVRHDKPA